MPEEKIPTRIASREASSPLTFECLVIYWVLAALAVPVPKPPLFLNIVSNYKVKLFYYVLTEPQTLNKH